MFKPNRAVMFGKAHRISTSAAGSKCLTFSLFAGKTHSLKHLNRVTSYTSVIAVPSSLFKNENKICQMGFARLKSQNIDRKKT